MGLFDFLTGDAPTAPDPAATAAAQYGYNKTAMQDSLKANALDQWGPSGSTTYTRDANGNPTGQQITLSPAAQALYNQQQQNSQGMQGVAGRMIGNLPTQASTFDPSGVGTGADVAQHAFDYQKGLLQPGFDRDRTNMNTDLTHRGLPVGSEAWNSATSQLNENQGNQLNSAANQAYLSGAQEQNTLYGQAQNTFSTNQNAQNQQFSNLGSVLGSAPQMSTPTFQNTATASAQAPDYTSAVNNQYNAQMKNYQADNSSLTSGLFGLGKLALGASTGGASLALTGI